MSGFEGQTDVLVAGGGPSGLAAAIHARARGLRVQVIEPRPGVIDKACGEGLMPAAVAALAALGVSLPVSHPFLGVRYVSGRYTAEGRFFHGTGLGVRRTVLHQALRDRAVAVGVGFIEGRVARITQDHRGVQVDGVHAGHLIVADGLNSPIRRLLGAGLPPKRPRRLGVRRHFAVAPWSPMVEVHWASFAEAYVTPVAPDQVGVAILYDPRAVPTGSDDPPFERLLACFPELASRLGDPTTPARGAGPFEQRTRRRVYGRILLVGDAAGYLDPITGEGIRLGLGTAARAVEAIAAGTPERYEAAWAAEVRRYWWMTDGLLWAARSPARPWLVPALRYVPGCMSLAIGALGG